MKPARVSVRLSFIIVLLLVGLFGLGVLFPVHASGLEYGWTESYGGTGDDYPSGLDLDASGNIYTVGLFSDTVDFDPGAGTAEYTSAGAYDTYVQKLSADGEYVWSFSLGSTGYEFAYDIVVDGQYFYITGYYQLTVDFDPGAGTENRTSVGGRDIFIAKYDLDGGLEWVVSFGGDGNDYPSKIAVDSDHNVYSTGSLFSTTADLDGTAGVDTYIPAGAGDPYLSKYQSNGTYVWGLAMGSAEYDSGQGLLVTSDTVYMTGGFRQTVDFDYGAGTQNRTAVGTMDEYIASYDLDGTYQDVLTSGTSGVTFRAIEITNDSAGNLVVTGDYSGGAVDLDPSASTDMHPQYGGYDFFLSKFSGSGEYLWSRSMGSPENDWGGVRVDTDTEDGILLQGYFPSTIDLDGTSGTDEYTSEGSTDIFLVRYAADGSYDWGKTIGAGGADEGYTIRFVAPDTILTLSAFSSTVDFNTTTGTDEHTSNGTWDIALSKFILDLDPPTIPTHDDTSVPFTGSDFTFSGVAQDEYGVALVEYQLGGSEGVWIECTPDDGAFDESEEAFTCSLSGVEEGEYTLFIRTTDSNNNTQLNEYAIEVAYLAETGARHLWLVVALALVSIFGSGVMFVELRRK